MPGRSSTNHHVAIAGLLGLVATCFVSSCAPPKHTQQTAPPSTPPANEVRLDQPSNGPPRFFHTAIDESFWVSHLADRDRLISFGGRLETSSKTGEVLASTWEIDNERKNEPLVGALEIAPRLGGGFVHWSKTQLFRSETFTGPLLPIATKHALGAEPIRGARNGLDGVIIFGESSNGKLSGSSLSLDPPPFAGLVDFAAVDEKRAVRIDLLGQINTTIDGGKTWLNATPIAGISLKQLLVEPDVISVMTWQGRLRFNADGTLGPLESGFVVSRRGLNFSTIFHGSRGEDTNAWWTWREIAPIQAAVLGGARTDAQHAVGFATGAIGEVNLETAELSRAITDWPQAGLSCSAIGGRSEPLFVCGWDTYQGYGAYVLRSDHGQWPPVVERAFTDDGFFVTDDHGALGFVGSCSVTPKYLDPSDSARIDMMSDAYQVAPKICVRRGPNEWLEHAIDIDPESNLQAWAAKKDGSAVALVVRKESALMPDQTNDPTRVTTQGGVQVVRIPRDVSGFSLSRPAWNPYVTSGRLPAGPLVERRIRVHDDGTISAWFSSQNSTDPSSGVHAGVVIDKRGDVALFPPPPRAITMIATSPYAVALLGDGSLAETLDHGQTYRPGGLSPLSASAFNGYCSMLGCVLGSITRLGWGVPATNPAVAATRLDAPASPNPRLRLECSAMGTPEPVDEKLLHKGTRLAWLIGSGDAVSLVREVENVPDAPSQMPPTPEPDDAPPPVIVAPPTKSKRPASRTQSLLFRAPFDPDALPKRLDATSSELDNVRRLGVIPLLGNDGDVGLLLISDKHEIVVFRDELTTLPLFENRRYFSDETRFPPGLLSVPNQPLIIGDVRRRSALEEHGIGTQHAPVYIGQERDSSTRKQMALARRDDGVQGLLVWEGFPSQVAAVSELDTKSRTFVPFTPLAPWTSATMGDDPRCKNMHGWATIVPIDPTLWFDVKALSANGVELNGSGLMLVRWGSERVCVDAVDLGLNIRTSYEWRFDNHLVMRWQPAGKKRRGGLLLQEGTRRRVDCQLTPVKEAIRQ